MKYYLGSCCRFQIQALFYWNRQADVYNLLKLPFEYYLSRDVPILSIYGLCLHKILNCGSCSLIQFILLSVVKWFQSVYSDVGHKDGIVFEYWLSLL